MGQCTSQNIDKRLNQIPDTTRDDQFLGLDGLWHTLKSIVEPRITYPKGKFYEKIPSDLSVDILDHLRINERKQLIVATPKYLKRYTGSVAITTTTDWTWVYSENLDRLFNSCSLKLWLSGGADCIFTIYSGWQKDALNEPDYSIHATAYTCCDTHVIIRFAPGTMFHWKLQTRNLCTVLNYEIIFFFDDSLPLLDEDDMASNSDVSAASQQSIVAYIASEIAGILLNEIGNPDDDTNFNLANKHLRLSWTTPQHTEDDGAFEIEALGNFGGDLVHIHQHTGNVTTPGTKLMHMEAEDDDVIVSHWVHGANALAFDKDGFQLGDSGAKVTEILDEDDMASDSAVKLATQQSIKAYVDSLYDNVNPGNIFGSNGFTQGLSFWSVANSDTNADIGCFWISQQTSAGWKILIVSTSTVASRTDSGLIRAGTGGAEEPATDSSLFFNVNFDLVHSDGNDYAFTTSSTFSLTKGKHIRMKWNKDNNAGSGDLRIHGIYLVK